MYKSYGRTSEEDYWNRVPIAKQSAGARADSIHLRKTRLKRFGTPAKLYSQVFNIHGVVSSRSWTSSKAQYPCDVAHQKALNSIASGGRIEEDWLKNNIPKVKNLY